MIALEEIEKTFHTGGVETPVLKDVTLGIEESEYVAIMGPSGTGKTTLMNIIGCLDKPTGGVFRFRDRDITSLDDQSLSELRCEEIGFVFQSFHLIERLRALDNVILPLLYARNYPRNARKRGLALLQAVGLTERVDFRPSALSGGQQQRVAIARALVNEPSFVLADEPTGNLDSTAGEELLGIFDELNSQGRTILLVTHDPEVAARAKRVITMKDGQIDSDRVTRPMISV